MLTTNVAFDPSKESKLTTKLSSKWSSKASVFALDKLEFANDGKVMTETSLVVDKIPGLKFEFKSDLADKADLCVTYKHKIATMTGQIDAMNFSKASATIHAGHGRYSAGAAADLKIAKASINSTTVVLGLGFHQPGSLFAGVRASKNLQEYSALFSYVAVPNATVAGHVNYICKDSAPTGALAAVYKYSPDTTFKVKALTSGTINASVKQQLEKKFVVVGSAEVPKSLAAIKFGVNATLG